MNRCSACMTVCLIFVVISQVSAQEWPRFRGSNGDGISHAKSIPSEWNEKDFQWIVDLPGEGHSSPVLWGSRLFLTGASLADGERYLMCFDALNGKRAWTKSFAIEKHKKHKQNSFATNSPAVDEKHVYLLQQSPAGSTLSAFTHEGQPAWQFDVGPFKGGHGAGISPIVVNDLVIVGNDHEGDSSLIAVDRHKGQEVWRVPRRSTRATYSTPCVFQFEEQSWIVFTDWQHGITALDPENGKVVWEKSVFGERKERAIGSPVTGHGLILGTCGFVTADKHAVALRPVRKQGKFEVEEVYRIERQVPHVPTPLVYRDWLFLWSEKGIVTCCKAASGEVVWQKRVSGNFQSSPVCIDGRIFCISDTGRVYVIAADDQYELLARNELGDMCRSTPAVANQRVYFRTVSKLFCLGPKPRDVTP